MNKHTPGPWQIDDCPDANGFTTIRIAAPGSPHGDTDAEPIATVYEAEPHNGLLIAAAPDMLATLQYVLDAHEYDGALTLGTAALSPAIRDRIKRTIAQAKGNP